MSWPVIQENTYKVTGPDGTSLYLGGGWVGWVYEAYLRAGTTAVTNAISRGMLCNIINSTEVGATSRFGDWEDTAVVEQRLAVNRTAASGNPKGIIGVALQSVAALVPTTNNESKPFRVAGMGSIVAVNSTGGAGDPAVGNPLIASTATAGSAMVSATSTPIGEVAGMCIKAAGTTANSQSGSVTQCGIMVNPGNVKGSA